MNIQKIVLIDTFLKNLVESVKAALKIIVLSKFDEKLPKTSFKECVIIGNGPSAKRIINEKGRYLRNCVTIGVNLLPLADEYKIIQPNYLVLIGRRFWEYDLNSPLDHIYQKYFFNLENLTSWPLSLILPKEAKQRIQMLDFKNPNLSFYYFNKNGVEGFDRVIFPLFKKNLCSPRCWNVMVAALFVGLNLGFKRLVLLGADHSWFENIHVSPENEVQMKQVHFYDAKQQVDYKPFLHSELNKTMSMPELSYHFYKVFSMYFTLNRYASYRKAEIINATENSYIDAFKKIDFDAYISFARTNDK